MTATTYRIALDPETDVAHAWLEGDSVTLCQRPIDGYRMDESASGVVRTTAMCGDCRDGYSVG